MLKKVIIFMLVGVLSLTLIPAYALGNDWTFNTIWYRSVVNNAYAVTTNEWATSASEGKLVNLFPDYNIFTGVAILDGYNVGNPLPQYSSGLSAVAFPAYSNKAEYMTNTEGNSELGYKYYTYDISFPFGVVVPSHSSMNFQFFQMFSNQFIPNSTVRLNFSDGKHLFLSGDNKKVSTYYNSELGNFTVDGNGTVVDYDTYSKGTMTVFDCSYNNDTPFDRTVESVSIYTATKGNFGYVGFFAENSNPVVLPDYVELLLSEIATELLNVYSSSQSNYNQLLTLTRTLNRIESLLGEDSAAVNQYYQTIVQPSQEQIIKQEELAQKVEEAKEQLAEIQSIIEKEPTVSYDDVESVTSQADLSIDEALKNEDTKKFFELLFNNSLISTMLISVIALATVGYILFGKKG